MKRECVILVVEDNPTERILMREAFEEIGIGKRVYAVEDGAEAITFLKGEGQYADRKKFPFPTFLLTDLKMPKVNGFELLLFLKRSHLIVIPTVVLTMSSDRDDVKKAFLLGANAYHTKPGKMEDFCRLLKTIYEYWDAVEIPDIDEKGNLIATKGEGKLSEKMRHPITHDPESLSKEE